MCSKNCSNKKSSSGSRVSTVQKPKKVKVYNNGEAHLYPFNLNPREFKGWTAILDHMTSIIKPRTGVIAKLIALSNKKEVQCFDDLDPKEAYVALGIGRKFQTAPGGYEVTSHRDILKRESGLKKHYEGQVDPSILPMLKETEKKHLTVAYFLVNGRNKQCGLKIILSRCDLKRQVITKNYLGKILDVPDGIQDIATIFGDILADLREIQHGFPYVVLPYNKPFVDIDYLKFFSKKSGCKPVLKFNIRPFGSENDSSKGSSCKCASKSQISLRAGSNEKQPTIDVRGCPPMIVINPCQCEPT